jgi:hypothetical protein
MFFSFSFWTWQGNPLTMFNLGVALVYSNHRCQSSKGKARVEKSKIGWSWQSRHDDWSAGKKIILKKHTTWTKDVNNPWTHANAFFLAWDAIMVCLAKGKNTLQIQSPDPPHSDWAEADSKGHPTLRKKKGRERHPPSWPATLRGFCQDNPFQ